MNYLTGIRLRELPEASSYLASLPVVKYLFSIEQLDFNKPVTLKTADRPLAAASGSIKKQERGEMGQ